MKYLCEFSSAVNSSGANEYRVIEAASFAEAIHAAKKILRTEFNTGNPPYPPPNSHLLGGSRFIAVYVHEINDMRAINIRQWLLDLVREANAKEFQEYEKLKQIFNGYPDVVSRYQELRQKFEVA